MSRGRGRLSMPAFLAELGTPRASLAALVCGTLALFAVGLDPRVFSAGTADAQAALRERPQLESLFLLGAIGEAAFLLVGGILGDTVGRRRVLLVGLAAFALFELGSMISVDGPLFFACRIAAVASLGLVLPPALAVVALAYTGVARATALGICYAGLGAATAISPALLAAVTPTLGRWPSFLLAFVATVIAFVAVRRSVPSTAPSGLNRRDVYPHALWALGLLAVTGAVLGLHENQTAARFGLIGLGVGLVALFLVIERRRQGISEDASIDIRPTTVALVAGVVIAIAQIAPALEIPLFFQIAQNYAPLLATIALAPFIIALIVGGPLAGLLLGRYSARALIVGGLAFVGIGDVLLGQAHPDTSYAFFIVPFAAVGLGFVVGTCVRTAVIFASTPRRLPATAAALNQTSLVVGTQIGIASVTALVGTAAIGAFSASVSGSSDAAGSVDAFRSFLTAIGTSGFGEVIGDLSHSTTLAYGAAFAAGVQSAMTVVGVATLIAAVLCWLAMPGPAKVESVWDLREERQPAA